MKQISSKNGERLEFRLEPSDDISSLKKQVAEKLAISEDCIKLIYKGRLFGWYFSHALAPWTGTCILSAIFCVGRFLKDGMNIESSGASICVLKVLELI